MQIPSLAIFFLLASFFFDIALSQRTWKEGIVKSELLFERASFAACHASTLAETKEGLVVAFFGGTEEKNPDVGIWLTRCVEGVWTPVVEIATGMQSNGQRYPCWNPVLFQSRSDTLVLYYKVGPSPVDWWGMVMRSGDHGSSWSKPDRLPDGILGPIRNKPVLLSTGLLVSPSSTERDGWKVHLEVSSDGGRTWGSTSPPTGRGNFDAIQPTILTYAGGKIQILCRTKQNCIAESWSIDGGKSWSVLQASSLPNSNSGIDAVTLEDGRQLLVYNHSTRPDGAWGGPRSPLNVAISENGKTWFAAIVLEDGPGEFSYPAVIQTRDKLVHVTYTWKRLSIKHVVIDPAKCLLREIKNGVWPGM